jgi:hypothetical protein
MEKTNATGKSSSSTRRSSRLQEASTSSSSSGALPPPPRSAAPTGGKGSKASTKTSDETSGKSSPKAPLSPKDAYFQRLNAATKASGALGSMLIRGVVDADDEENEDESEGDNYTAEQISRLRHIIINASRDKCLTAAMDFASAGQSGSMISMFNTHTGNTIIAGIPSQVNKAMKQKSLSASFDSLFALTFALNRYDEWMYDNEEYGKGGGLDKAIKLLGSSWKKLLGHSDAELGIDSAFTRPGIEVFLEIFERTVAGCDTIEVPFTYY